MLQITRKGFLLAVLTSAVMSAHASTAPAPKTQYNLMDIYQLALENNAELAAALASKNATQEVLTQSRAGFMPQVVLDANLQHAKVDLKGKPSQSGNTHGWGASVTQPLINAPSWFTYGQAKHTSNQAEAVFANAQQQLILTVAEAYFGILSAQDTLLTAKAKEKALKQQLDQTRERYKVGLIAETDVLDSMAAYDNARVARIQADNALFVQFSNMQTIVNQEVASVAHLNKEMPIAAPMPNNPQEWVDQAVANNRMLQASRDGVSASESNVRTQKSGFAPTVNAFAKYSWESNELAAGSGPTPQEGSTTTFGVSMSFPIFTGLTTVSQSRQAGYQLEEAQQNYDQALRTTEANTRSLYRTTVSDMDQVNANCQVITSSESALRATQSGYEVGTRNITEVLDAQQNLYSAISNYYSSRYNFIINGLKLKQTAGSLAVADLEELNKWVISGKEELTVPKACQAGGKRRQG